MCAMITIAVRCTNLEFAPRTLTSCFTGADRCVNTFYSFICKGMIPACRRRFVRPCALARVDARLSRVKYACVDVEA